MEEPGNGQTVRKYSVLCPIHEIRYNPAESDGCVLCHKEKQPEPRAGSWKNTLILLGLVLVVGFVTYRAVAGYMTPAPTTQQTAGSAGSKAAGDANLVDPGPFRDLISQIESVLYKSGPASLEDLGSVDRAAVQLADKITQSGKSRLAVLPNEILFWSSRLTAQEEFGYASPNLSSARTEWENLRRTYFAPAPWFRHSSPEIEAGQQFQRPEADPSVVSGLDQSASAIEQLLELGRADCLRLPEISGDADRQAASKLREWNEWSRAWESRVDSTSRTLPGRAATAGHPDVVSAYQSLASALHSLRLLTRAANDFGVPFMRERENRLAEAAGHLREAKGRLGRLR